ncbi:MAG TPA: LysR family transcriptional regulator [Chroococcales cyanobacterium]
MKDRLHVFSVVAEKLNFTQAAQELYMSQPAVSAAIKNLESEYGLPLFSRAGGHVELTDAGRILQNFSKRMQNLENQAAKEIKALSDNIQGQLTIGASTTLAQYILPKLIGDFASSYPQVTFSLVCQSTEQIAQLLVEGKVDMAAVEGEVHSSQFTSSVWMTDELQLNAPNQPGIPDSIAFEELLKLPLLMRERGSGHRQRQEQHFHSRGVALSDLNIVLEFGSTEAVKLAIEHGLGWAFLSNWACRKERALGTLKVVEVPGFRIIRDLFILQTKESENMRLAQRFINFINRSAGQLAANEPLLT